MANKCRRCGRAIDGATSPYCTSYCERMDKKATKPTKPTKPAQLTQERPAIVASADRPSRPNRSQDGPNRRRNHYVALWLSDEEKAKLDLLVQQQSTAAVTATISDVIRWLIGRE